MGLFCIILGIIAMIGFTGAGFFAAETLFSVAGNLDREISTSQKVTDLLNISFLKDLTDILKDGIAYLHAFVENATPAKIVIVAGFTFIGLMFGISLITTGLTYRRVRRLEKRLKARHH